MSQHDGDDSTADSNGGGSEDRVQPASAAAAAAAASTGVAALAAASALNKKSNKAKFAAATAPPPAAPTVPDERKGDNALGEVVPASSAANPAESQALSPSPPERSVSASPELPPMTDDEILDTLPMPKPVSAVPDLLQTGPNVHSLTFPHPKHEKWYILLVQKTPKKQDQILAYHKVTSFFDDASVELRFMAPKARSAKEDGLRPDDPSAGLWTYDIHAICDSYVGVDVIESFTLKVEKSKHASAEEHAKAVREKVKEEYAELLGDEDEEEGAAGGEMGGIGGYLAQALAGGDYPPGKWSAMGQDCVTVLGRLGSSDIRCLLCWLAVQVLSRFRHFLGAGPECSGADTSCCLHLQLHALTRLLATIRLTHVRLGGRHAATACVACGVPTPGTHV
jgi:hypothetical protein